MRRLLTYFCLFLLLVGAGCASTTVHKDPGKHDKGLRFYRPKPYLLITPLDAAKWGNVGPDEMVEMKLDWLPDFAEEYSVRIKTGIGTNKTKVTLENGWKLTNLDVDVDAKFKDNLDAITNLVKTVAPSGLLAAPKPKTTGADDEMVEDPSRPYRAVVHATNVPLGYYESVIGHGPDGHNQLFGWRYVGFAPFAGCPMVPTGGDNCPCDPNNVYGLAFENGVMTFKQLTTLPGAGDAGQTRRPIAMPPSTPAEVKKSTEDKVKDAVVNAMKSLKLGDFSAKLVTITPTPIGASNTVAIDVAVTQTTLMSVGLKVEDVQKALDKIKPDIVGIVGEGKTVTITVKGSM